MASASARLASSSRRRGRDSKKVTAAHPGGLTIPRIYVGHLSSSIKKCDLYYLFHKFGDIVEIMIKDDFAFIEYTNLHSAYRAMTELNGYRLGGCKLQIEEAKPREGENFEEFYYRNRANMLASSKMYLRLMQGS